MTSLPRSFALVFALAVAACGGGQASGPCQRDCVEQSLAVYQGLGVRIEPGDEVEWVYGFQGGVMIRPLVVVMGEEAAPGDQVRVEIRHLPDPEAPDALGEAVDFPENILRRTLQEGSEGPFLGPVDDQIGYGDPSGNRLLLEVTLRGPTWVATETVPIVLGPPPT